MVRTPLDVELIYRVAPDSAIAVERMSARPNFYETSTAMKSVAIALLLTPDSFRHMEDFVTWVDTSKLKRTIMNYNDEVHPHNPLSFHSHLTHTFSSLTTSISFNPLLKIPLNVHHRRQHSQPYCAQPCTTTRPRAALRVSSPNTRSVFEDYFPERVP